VLWEPHILQNGRCFWNILKLAITTVHDNSSLSIEMYFVQLLVSMVAGVVEPIYSGFTELVPKNADQMTKVPWKQTWSSGVVYFFCCYEETVSPFSILVSQLIKVAIYVNFQFFLTNECTFFIFIFIFLFNSPYLCFDRDSAIIRGTLISSLHCSLVHLVLSQYRYTV
jgi:ABC-type Mn2+/Zn2+ transport system permease subunit